MNLHNDYSSKSRGHISITPQMILAAIKRLHLRKVYVPSNLISEYLRGSYPVENNVRMFTEELKRKLDCAVRVGLILKHGEDLYYLPTLRQKANALKTAFTAFWEIYKNYPKFRISKARNQNKNHFTLKERTKNRKYSKNNDDHSK
ncbi:uncharacterized protein LOC117207039 [Bombus bifarius]|uniref:Uncharacterized protein LOC117207039 n=2 Tax=Pyrobombus TaxID=144703 RepID=A0A6P8ML69_9HYME|nr:uncharacterized protein LOC117154346 [Bombus vancouverensis nearcticus]XP_033302747.1 uncharacterized protein LOC117207039 [Bombus bifarius]